MMAQNKGRNMSSPYNKLKYNIITNLCFDLFQLIYYLYPSNDNIKLVYIHKRLTTNGFLKDFVKKEDWNLNESDVL